VPVAGWRIGVRQCCGIDREAVHASTPGKRAAVSAHTGAMLDFAAAADDAARRAPSKRGRDVEMAREDLARLAAGGA
jgi:hypothetical protein